MTPPRSILASVRAHPQFGRPWIRRAVLGVLIVLCAVFTLFPERYRSAVTLTPTDPSSLGLGAALGQLGALNSVFGNQAAIEIALKMANSVEVRNTVSRQLKLQDRLGLDNQVAVSRWLDRNVEVRTLRGGIVQVQTLLRDGEFGRQLVGAIAEATRNQLASVQLRQTAYKRDVLLRLVDEANVRLSEAQRAYDTFRLGAAFTDPETSLRAISTRIPTLEAAIKAKEVELQAARRIRTDDNVDTQQIMAQLDALRGQLRVAQASNPARDNSVGRVVGQSTEADRLLRELETSRALYYSYQRYLDGTAVENLTSGATVRILETPYVDSQRQLNRIPLAIGILLVLIALAMEFYALRPPVGDRRMLVPAE